MDGCINLYVVFQQILHSADASHGQDRNTQEMGKVAWASSLEMGEDAQQRLQQDPDAPPFAPFYWGVREHRNGDLGSKKVVKRIRQLIKDSVPSFMDQKNAESLFEHAEFWLGAKGTGARAHMDSHCISTLSVVLHGERRWRIGPVPRLPKGAGRSPDDEVVFDDGVAYKLGWKPMFEFTVKEGEAVLFPPGWIHETLNTADDCTVALTTQFVFPTPVRYYRSFYNRLRRIGDLNSCWRDMMSWAGAKVPKGDAKALAEKIYGEIEQKTKALEPQELDFFDLDEDQSVSKEEYVQTFTAWAATEKAIRKEKRKHLPKCEMSWDDKVSGDKSVSAALCRSCVVSRGLALALSHPQPPSSRRCCSVQTSSDCRGWSAPPAWKHFKIAFGVRSGTRSISGALLLLGGGSHFLAVGCIPKKKHAMLSM